MYGLDDITQLDFGYLTGSDLLIYLPADYLQVVNDLPGNIIQSAVSIAKNKVMNYLAAIYDLTTEYQKTGEERNPTVVQLVSFLACNQLAMRDEAMKTNLKAAWEDFRITIDELKTRRQSLHNVTTISDTPLMKGVVVSVSDKYLS